MSDPIKELLEERQLQYGDSWCLVDRTIGLLGLDAFKGLLAAGYLSNWVQVCHKMWRAVVSPTNPEHWRDIAGYARLSLDDLEQKEELPPPPPSSKVVRP